MEWWDIFENSVGDTTKAEVAVRTSFGLFWEEKESQGTKILVTTTTLDSSPDQSGFCAYPMGCVKSITIEKKRGRRKKKDAGRNDVASKRSADFGLSGGGNLHSQGVPEASGEK